MLTPERKQELFKQLDSISNELKEAEYPHIIAFENADEVSATLHCTGHMNFIANILLNIEEHIEVEFKKIKASNPIN